ncbi:hypothetical protein HMPREF9371_2389 [Neisseria shayeganii 871]|uniref:Uncharacterized protein n=1 Tax=Neisseria shayeganii 871 TaxID=1032488 RepID=G4CL98_9NEIS|nr:hypothetical protein HMPREF9371_2389 [Neisseria shayeganii 871]
MTHGNLRHLISLQRVKADIRAHRTRTPERFRAPFGARCEHDWDKNKKRFQNESGGIV